jgi:hypothetical protein
MSQAQDGGVHLDAGHNLRFGGLEYLTGELLPVAAA